MGFYVCSPLNLQGGNSQAKKLTLAEDMVTYGLEFMGTIQTKMGNGCNVETLKSKCGKQLKHYTSGGKNKTTKHGIGIFARADLNLEFEAVNERICKATLKESGKTTKYNRHCRICTNT